MRSGQGWASFYPDQTSSNLFSNPNLYRSEDVKSIHNWLHIIVPTYGDVWEHFT